MTSYERKAGRDKGRGGRQSEGEGDSEREGGDRERVGERGGEERGREVGS